MKFKVIRTIKMLLEITDSGRRLSPHNQLHQAACTEMMVQLISIIQLLLKSGMF